MSQFDTWESFFYPETYNVFDRQGTMQNKFGERGFDTLRELEYGATTDRVMELQQGSVPIDRTYGIDHLQAIHRYLFQDVYEWAGEIRPVNIGKGGAVRFANVREPNGPSIAGTIRPLLNDVQEYVRMQDWGSVGPGELAAHASVIFAYVNQAHPFREGNGRVSKVFMQHVAEQTPYTFDFSRIDDDVWNQASEKSRPQADRAWIDPSSLIPVFTEATQVRTYSLMHEDDIPYPMGLSERLAAKVADLRAEHSRGNGGLVLPEPYRRGPAR